MSASTPRRSPRRLTGRTRLSRSNRDSTTTMSPPKGDDATSISPSACVGSYNTGKQDSPEFPNLFGYDSRFDLVDHGWEFGLPAFDVDFYTRLTTSPTGATDRDLDRRLRWEEADTPPLSNYLPSPPQSDRLSPPSSYSSEDGNGNMSTSGGTWMSAFTCDCHGLGFARRADLERHLAKEKGRYTCELPDCASKNPRFGTLSDKKRHYHEVHGKDLDGNPSKLHTCPWSSCKRHDRGFPRKQNLEAHIANIHAGKRPPVDATPISPRVSPPAEPVNNPSQLVTTQWQKSPSTNDDRVTSEFTSERTTGGYAAQEDALFSNGPFSATQFGFTSGRPNPSSALKLEPPVDFQALEPPDVTDVLNLSQQDDDEVMQIYMDDFQRVYGDLKTLKQEMEALQEQVKRGQMELKRRYAEYQGLRTLVNYEGNKVRKRKAQRQSRT